MARVPAVLLAACLATLAPAVLAQSDDAKKQFREWTVERIEQLRTSRDTAERAKAAEWLGGSSDADAIEALAAALGDREARVRQAAASALWKSDKAAAPAREALKRALDDPDANVVASAAGALQATGTSAAELAPVRRRVLAAAEATPGSQFTAARGLIGQDPPTTLLPPIVAWLERNAALPRDGGRGNVEMAEQALQRLVKTGDPGLVRPLMAAASASRAAQAPLLRAVGKAAPRAGDYTAFVVSFFGSTDWKVRFAALDALRGQVAEPDVQAWAPRVGALLRDPDSSVRSNALWVLGEAGALAASQVDAVVAALGDPEASVRGAAARALGEMGRPNQAVAAAAKSRVIDAAGPALAAAEKDADKEVRERVAYARKQIGGTAGGSAPVPATAAATSAAGEAGGMAVLRAKKVNFDEASFMGALSQGDVEVVRAFLDAGMSAKAPLGELGPPLRVMFFASPFACQAAVRPTKAETKALVALLLQRGADANGADARGNAPLMEAATKGCDREVMKLLLKAGAKVGAKNAAGLTAFEMGLYSGHDGLEEIVAAGYRLPPEKVKAYEQAYAKNPAAVAMVKKASGKK